MQGSCPHRRVLGLQICSNNCLPNFDDSYWHKHKYYHRCNTDQFEWVCPFQRRHHSNVPLAVHCTGGIPGEEEDGSLPWSLISPIGAFWILLESLRVWPVCCVSTFTWAADDRCEWDDRWSAKSIRPIFKYKIKKKERSQFMQNYANGSQWQ
jgi:hypothetical protein